jgi:hypothetical protein
LAVECAAAKIIFNGKGFGGTYCQSTKYATGKASTAWRTIGASMDQ